MMTCSWCLSCAAAGRCSPPRAPRPRATTRVCARVCVWWVGGGARVHASGALSIRPHTTLPTVGTHPHATTCHPCAQPPERTVASYIRAVLRTVAQCHAKCIIHRDIKPDNVRCRPGGGDERARPAAGVGGWSFHTAHAAPPPAHARTHAHTTHTLRARCSSCCWARTLAPQSRPSILGWQLSSTLIACR